MKFKCDNLFLYVEGIQFFNGEYETTNKDEIEILNKYKDSVFVVEEIIEPIQETKDKVIGETKEEVMDESITEDEKVDEVKKTNGKNK